MELGLSPVISAGWILQLLIGTRLVELDMSNAHDVKLYEGGQKVLAMILAFG
jgi:preprotein translocase subunit SecY